MSRAPATGARAGFTATGEINRMDFGISYNGPIPGGGVTLGEKVQIVLEIESRAAAGGGLAIAAGERISAPDVERPAYVPTR